MILAIDPGRHPAYVLLDPGNLVRRVHLPYSPETPLVVGVSLSLQQALVWTDCRVSHIVIEGQHGKLETKRRRAILTLGNEAGWQLRAAVERFAGAPCIVHPQALTRADPPGWRDGLRCGGCPKAVVQRRIERSLTPTEASLFRCTSAARMGDCLDATAVGWGAWILGLNTLTWSPPP